MSELSNAPEPFVEPKVIAAHLGIAVYTVYQHASTGKIPGVKVGSQWRFKISEVDAYLNRPRDPWQQSPQSLGRKRRS
jgi:excisionase family DNA binding protein